MKIRDLRRAGLVEIEAEAGKVHLVAHPPGAQTVRVILSPDDARGLARGLRDGATEAERDAGVDGPPHDYGQVAYEAHWQRFGDTTVGRLAPPWADLTAAEQSAWNAAAEAVSDYLGRCRNE